MRRDDLAATLKARAVALDLSTLALATRSGMTERQVRRVLSGESAKLETVEVIANTLGLEVALVLRGRG